jgi:ketosteroid isomerase-like protein
MKILAIVILLFATAAGAQTPKPPANSEQPLFAADRAFNADTAKRRLDGWMAAFADNAVLFAAKPPVVGKDAIRAFYQPNFADPDFSLSWQPTRAEMFPSGDMGYTTGRYELHAKDAKGNKVVRHGSYLTVWRKQPDGSWKVIADGGAADPH